MTRNIIIALFIVFQTPLLASNPAHTDKRMTLFIDSLMQQMTIAEKIGQLNLLNGGDFTTGESKNNNIETKIAEGKVGGFLNVVGVDKIRRIQQIAIEQSRLKIPLLFGLDVIHGYNTTFPMPIGLATTWDMEAIERTARIAALEASKAGIQWTFSPMVDISRDPRWGRVSEGGGEDPFLGGEIAKAMVRGYQGDNTFSDNSHILACVKHFALYGASEAGRDYNTVDMSSVRMFNDYLYPYKAAIEAGAVTVMTAFNDINGIPCTANKWLLTDVLRDQWGFNGFVVTDYTTVPELKNHGLGDDKTVSALALQAGVDMDMVGETYLNNLEAALNEGLIDEALINTSCRRILEAKYKLGLFHDPYKFCKAPRSGTLPHNSTLSPAGTLLLQEGGVPEGGGGRHNSLYQDFLRKVTADGFVLLKNENQLLPLSNDKKIALIGPLANTKINLLGTWSALGDAGKAKTVLEALQDGAKDKSQILYAKGCNLTYDQELETRATRNGRSLNRDQRTVDELNNEALGITNKSDIIVAVLGESSEFNGECASRVDLNIPDAQKDLLMKLHLTGKPIVLVILSGRPLTLTWEDEHIPAILNTWYGQEMGPALSDVLFGKVNPSGKLVMTYPRSVGQIPIYYNHKTTGRPMNPDKEGFQKFRSIYLDSENTPLYPFGYGLSYTTYDYGEVILDKPEIQPNETLHAQINITNTGKVEGTEIVQFYIRDKVCSITRPVKELKGFKRISLKPGQTQTVTFEITPEMLKFYNSELQHISEPGDFEVMIGRNSEDVKSRTFRLTASP